MNRYEELYQTVIKNNYDVRSGVYSAIDHSIVMKLDEFGQYAATVDSASQPSDEVSQKLLAVSAMSDTSPDEDTIAEQLFEQTPGIEHDPIIGYHLALFAGHVVEDDYRQIASSGGFTTWLLKELLINGHIDGVIHVQESSSEGVLFEYDISTTVDQIRAGAKTRYYPVELSDTLNKIKKLDGKYAVVGLPSFIMEMRLLANEDQNISKRIAFTLGLICGHQKSTKYAESFAWQNGIKPGNLKSIDFRKKVEGTPANKYATEMTGLINGEEITITKKQDDLFGSHWGHGFFKTKFSDYTDDALNETADVALGDAWLPEYTKDSMGDNILIVRDLTILELIKQGRADGKVKIDQIDTSTILRSQSGLIHQYRDDLPYRLYKRDKADEWRPTKRLPASNDIPYLRKIVQSLREEITKQSHIHYRRAIELDDWNYFERKMKPLLRRYSWVYVLIKIKDNGLGWLIKKLRDKVR